MSCKRYTELISQSMDRPLKKSEKVALRFHMVICKTCRRYRTQLLLLRRALNERLADVDKILDSASGKLTPEMRQRIREALERQNGT